MGVNARKSGSIPEELSSALNHSAWTVVMPTSAAPCTSPVRLSPTYIAASGSTSSSASARRKISGSGLTKSDLGREHADVEQIGQTEGRDIGTQHAARIRPRVGDDARLQAASAERLEQRLRGAEDRVGRTPHAVLDVDEAVDFLRRQLAEQLTKEVAVVVARRRTLEHDLAVALGEPLVRAADRRERRLVARDEQVVVPREFHEGVVPVEEHRFQHGWLG